ncbi:MAG TPA: hypothetical protein VFF70_05255 [Anaerolineae bacterium]|jgi:hypothetical protein|nr:hypothetical protein [Anaerolineae bacterium]
MFFSITFLGWICLAAAILLTFFYPLGQLHRSHVVSQAAMFICYVMAAFILIPYEWVPQDLGWKALIIGAIVGLLAIIFRDIRRFFRFFHGKIYRMTHPYYWYSRAFRSLSRRQSR